MALPANPLRLARVNDSFWDSIPLTVTMAPDEKNIIVVIMITVIIIMSVTFCLRVSDIIFIMVVIQPIQRHRQGVTLLAL